MEKLKGVFTALITPFDQNNNIDEDGLRCLVNFQIEAGISGLVPCGTTGESPTLSHEEHKKVIEIVIQENKSRALVIAGTGSNSTEEAIDLTRHAREAGADYSLQVAPYYNKPTQEGFFRHFEKIAQAVDIPLIIYNIAGRTGKNITTDTIRRLSKVPNIVAVKEASGDINQMMDVYQATDEDFSLLSGDDNMTLPLMAAGGDGVISVASNVAPKKLVEMYDLIQVGDFNKAAQIHYDLLGLFKACFLETNPIPIKFMTSVALETENSLRLPMTLLSSENEKVCLKVLKKLNLITQK